MINNLNICIDIDRLKQIKKDLNEKIIYILLQQGKMNYKI